MKPIEQDTLRAAAEARLARRSARKQESRPVEKLLHELETHQIELEMQNDELRKSQALMEKMRDRFVDLYEFAPISYLTLNRTGMIAEANLTGAALLGVERKNLLNLRFSNFVTHEDKYLWDQHFLSVFQRDGQQSCELSLQRPDGSRLHALITSLKTDALLSSHDLDDPLYQDNSLNTALLLRLVITDISERKRLDDELRIEANRLKLAEQIGKLGFLDWDLATNEIFVSDETLRIYGITSGKNRLKPEELTILVHPDDLAHTVKSLHNAIETGARHDIEHRILRTDGTEVYVHTPAEILRDANGKPIRLLGTVHDITERKHAESQLRNLTAYVQSVREEEKANIAREIHDDLGGTLLTLKMGTHRLKDELSARMDAKPLLDHVQEMSQAIDHAAVIMRDIITGLRPPILVEIGLLAAFEWQAVHFQNRTGINCRVNCVGDKGNLDILRSIELFRISQEALSNVARHSGASSIEFEYLHNDNEVVMSITDNGRGMPETHSDTSKHFGLLGMRERVGQLNGTICFDTSPGGGFSVTVILPLSANERENK